MKDRRIFFQQGLSKLYLPYYTGLCDLLPAEWQPFQGFRSFDAQTALYSQGRAGKPGPIVTWAKAGESAHNYGCATDWTVWDEKGLPIWLDESDSRWQVYEQACSKVGAEWGGNFPHQKLDRPHNELLISCGWPHILVAYKQGGMTAAQQHIEESLIR